MSEGLWVTFADTDPLDVKVKVTAWRKMAACRDSDPSLFFVGRGANAGNTNAPYDAARLICARCPVTARCLATQLWEVSLSHDAGCWAGTSPDQRARIRRRVAALTGTRADDHDG